MTMVGTRESNAKWSESEYILCKVSKIFSQFACEAWWGQKVMGYDYKICDPNYCNDKVGLYWVRKTIGSGGRFEKAEWDGAKDVLHLRCFFNTQVERSSRHLNMSLEFGTRISRGIPEARSRLCVCRASFLMTFVMGGVPHAGSRQW